LDEPLEKQQFKEKRLNFFEKFFELQKLMFSHNSGLTASHPYASGPLKWPLLNHGISFWENKEGLRQIYLLGNPFIWWTCSISVALYACLWIVDRIALRRGIERWDEKLRSFWDRGTGFMFIGWLLHWLPFFVLGRQLFLHHYLPSFIFSVFVTAGLFDYVGRVSLEDPYELVGGKASLAMKLPYYTWIQGQGSVPFFIVLAVAVVAYLWCFIKFSPLSYGTGMDSGATIKKLQWLSTWAFQHASS
jgi:dolichyl-phosphate-mannose-protein mannosyltransferase